MSAEVIKEFLVGLGFSIDNDGLAKWKAKIASASTSAIGLVAALNTAATGIFIGVKSIADDFDKLDKLATRLRVSADALDEFSDAAGLLGISEEIVADGLKSLDKAASDTALGVGRSKIVFEKLGVSVKDSHGKLKPVLDILGELQGKFSKLEKGKQIAILERLGLDPVFIKLMNADMATLRKEMEAIDKAAGVDFSDSIAQSKAFMTSWRELKVEVEIWKLTAKTALEAMATKFMPRFRVQILALTQAMQKMRANLLSALPAMINLVMRGADAIVRFSEATIQLMSRVFNAINVVVPLIAKLIGYFGNFPVYIAGAIVAWNLLNSAFIRTPLGMFVTLATSLALLFDDFMTFKEGGQSLIDWSSKLGTGIKVLTVGLSSLAGYMIGAKVTAIAMAAATSALSVVTAAFGAVMSAVRTAVLLFNLALYTNPVGIAIAGILALSAVIAGAIIYWDDIKAAVGKFIDYATENLLPFATFIASTFGFTGDNIIAAFTKVKDWFVSFFDFFSKKIDWVINKAASIKNLVGAPEKFTSNQAAIKPSYESMAAIRAPSVNQKNEINITGVSDPQAAADFATAGISKNNTDLIRNMRPNLR